LFAQNLKKILSSLYKHQKEKTPLTLKNRISYTLKPTGDTFLVLVNLESFVFYVFAIKEIKFPKG